MNILIPDNWLREYLKTKATPEQIKEYLSLCGPSVERIHHDEKEIIYDIEITTNRPDAMSVVGVAREAAAILPRFGIAAKLISDPYALDTNKFVASHRKENTVKLAVKTNSVLNPRFTAIIIDNVAIKPSPAWLRERLEATGIRSINNVVDTTNYIMRAFGQPVHAFDFDQINPKKNTATMIVRGSKKGEKIITLDGKSHVLGDDIVIEDGQGRLIDLCGIMGGANSHITNQTKRVILFMQTYNPVNIRKTSMRLGQRTEAAALFEKSLDPELVLPAMVKGLSLMLELTGGKIASKLYDIYPKPYKPYSVTCAKEKLTSYVGVKLNTKEIENILKPLGFVTRIPGQAGDDIKITVPSWRRDVTLDVDVIEEVARIYGYHNTASELPATAPPIVFPDPELSWEQEIKIRLRDWGFTETYTYSMISEKLMDIFGLDKTKAYKISNPLSEEWVYMRPTLIPSMLLVIQENLKHTSPLQLFELSMVYEYQPHDLPKETPMLLVAWTGNRYREIKGISEVLGATGSVSGIDVALLQKMEIKESVSVYYAPVSEIVKKLSVVKQYIPIPKYPPIIEDFSFVVPPNFQVGPLINVLSKVHKLIQSVTILDAYENKRTIRVTYLDPTKTLTASDIAPVHQKILEYAAEKFGVAPVTA